MANITEMAFRPNDWFEQASGTNATVTVTRAAPGGQRRHLVRDVMVTLSAVPTAAGTLTLSGGQLAGNGGPSSTTLLTIPAGSPTGLIVPVNLLCDVNQPAVASVTALGAGVAAVVVLLGMTVSA